MLTRGADERLAAVHDRMPVVLPLELHGAWLDDGERATEVSLASSSAGFEWHPISTRVNDVRNDDELLTREAEELPEPPQALLF